MSNEIDAYLQGMVDTVAEHGLAVQGVFSPEGDEEPGPDFAYTVGLAAAGKPELISFGLPMHIAQSILNDLGFRMLRGLADVAAGDTVYQLIADYPVKLVAVADSGEHLTVANRLYGNPDDGALPALQIVFPDAAGRFPWDPGSTIAWQPVLGEPTDGREITLEEA